MGLLGKLFEKKYCSICGKEIAILGNKKLRDGNCCGTCEGVLSPYFSERRQASVEEIKHQIRCRTANIEKLRNFNMTRRIGDSVKVMIDEGKNQFIVSDPKY
ncbi:MAG: DUF4428 domain-containing protein, partial [Oscillospiraceae bacterium]|nr:DUF4428 domain-containing protein [Oscillospiraceae bacterium]